MKFFPFFYPIFRTAHKKLFISSQATTQNILKKNGKWKFLAVKIFFSSLPFRFTFEFYPFENGGSFPVPQWSEAKRRDGKKFDCPLRNFRSHRTLRIFSLYFFISIINPTARAN